MVGVPQIAPSLADPYAIDRAASGPAVPPGRPRLLLDDTQAPSRDQATGTGRSLAERRLVGWRIAQGQFVAARVIQPTAAHDPLMDQMGEDRRGLCGDLSRQDGFTACSQDRAQCSTNLVRGKDRCLLLGKARWTMPRLDALQKAMGPDHATHSTVVTITTGIALRIPVYLDSPHNGHQIGGHHPACVLKRRRRVFPTSTYPDRNA